MSAATPEPRADGRLPDLARPTRYRLALDVDPREARYGGTVRIDVTVPRATRAIVLHGRGLTVRRASVTPAGAIALPATATSRAANGGRGEPEELVLTTEGEIPAGNATIEIGFDREYERGLSGLYRVRSGGLWYAFTQMEPNDARRAFPCFDEPGFKVPWEIALTIPQGMVGVGNMPEASRAENADRAGTTTLQFAPTPPTSSYLVAIAVGPFDVVEGARSPIPIRAITTHGQGALTRLILDAAEAHARILGEYFGRAYPYPKLDLVAVPEFNAGAMENPGLITFREELMLLDSSRASTRTRRYMAAVLAHELAHQWFGDLVTMTWWNDLWLNEGFATWAQSKVVDQWQPAFGARLEALQWRTEAMETDALASARAVRQPVTSTGEALEAFDWITYRKGAAVLAMLEHWIGEDVFRAGVRDYVHTHEWGNATAADLFAALGAASHADVAGVAATFLDQPGVPLVAVDVACPAGGLPPTMTVTQSRYQVARTSAAVTSPGATAASPAAADPLWHIPVCVQYQAAGGSQRTCVLSTERSITTTLPGATQCPRWVYPNADEAGYYRYALTPSTRGLIQPEGLRGQDVRVRAGIIANAWALVRGGQLPIDEFLHVLDAYRAERDKTVIDAAVGALTELFSHVADEETRPALRTWIAGFFGPIARELRWTGRANESDDRKLLRRAVYGMLGSVADDPATLAQAERHAQSYLRDPRSIDPDLASLAVPMASKRADAPRLEALLAALPNAGTPQDRSTLSAALASFETPALLQRALDATLTDVIRVQDIVRLLQAAEGHPVRRPIVTAWVRDHFDALRARMPGDAMGRLAGGVASACSSEEIAAFEAFWRPRVGQFQAGERPLREGIEHAEQCVSLRERERGRLRSALAGPVTSRRPRH